MCRWQRNSIDVL
ncbi:hypothetical protein C7Y44_19130 [Paenibacillus popilliae]|uniref:Uncharacterized protein n=1 Tax=Paenibacillus popilliae TaxID=78057 RepID=A0ABY3ARC9_PAEPP|nr:hypothetical protein C7Y44_19130 [Paenibacillus sp. SDF0028]